MSQAKNEYLDFTLMYIFLILLPAVLLFFALFFRWFHVRKAQQSVELNESTKTQHLQDGH
jgi:hypothetical protein